ncbi:hypothetical protein OIE68_19885 [Nocardia vinacea]|nr:hypothetical protein OIE68_19885 [Nocardia vinacea]
MFVTSRLDDLMPTGLIAFFERPCRREQLISRPLMVVGEAFGSVVALVIVIHQSRPHRFGNRAVCTFEISEPSLRDFTPLPELRRGQMMLLGDSAQLIRLDSHVSGHARLIPPASYLRFIVPPSQNWGAASPTLASPAIPE